MRLPRRNERVLQKIRVPFIIPFADIGARNDSFEPDRELPALYREFEIGREVPVVVGLPRPAVVALLRKTVGCGSFVLIKT
jgi:hypothetical protein